MVDGDVVTVVFAPFAIVGKRTLAKVGIGGGASSMLGVSEATVVSAGGALVSASGALVSVGGALVSVGGALMFAAAVREAMS